MQKKLTKRKLQAEETKKRILTVAKQLIEEHGFENVSIDAVAQGAGISKGAFYVHFESKDALATILLEDYVRTADLNYQTFLNTIDPAAKTADAFLQLIEKIATVIESIGCENMRALYKTHLTNSANSVSSWSYSREIYTLFRNLLEKGIQQGDIKSDLSPDLLAKHCVLALRGVVFEWCIRYPEFDLRQECMKHFQILLRGIV